ENGYVRRAKRTPAAAIDAARIPLHHASEIHGLEPAGVPSRSARSVSVMGVIGWWSANPCSQRGIVSTGAKALLAEGRNMMRKVTPLAASGERARRPRAA